MNDIIHNISIGICITTLHNLSIYICLDLEYCTEDGAENSPLLVAARYLPKAVFEEEVTKEPTTEQRDDTDQQIPKPPIVKAKFKADSKADNAPVRGGLHEISITTGKDTKAKKRERVEKITAGKGRAGKVETTFHVLLQHNVKVNKQNNTGVTALHAACGRGIIVMVKELLLCEDIDINKKDKQQNTPLHTACVSGEKDIVLALIEAGAEVMETNKDHMNPLQVAVVEQKLEIVKAMLDMCTDNKESLLRSAVKDGSTPFLLAVKTGDEEMVKYFLDNGADIFYQNNNGATALHLATSLNKVKIMEILYEADAESDHYLMESDDWDGLTPLHYAAKYNHIEALEFLLNK